MITTTHNEHEIRYSEHSDTWECYRLNLSAKTLSALKAKINKVDAQARRIDGEIYAYIIAGYYDQGKKVKLTLLDGDNQVWVLKPDGNSYSRSKEHLNTLAPDSEETRAALAEYREAQRKAKEANQHAQLILSRIPRLTKEALVALGHGAEA